MGYYDLEAEVEFAKEEAGRERKHLYELLCSVCEAFEHGPMPANVVHWWDQQRPKIMAARAQAAEEQRLRQVKMDALAKLSAEERQVLGLK